MNLEELTHRYLDGRATAEEVRELDRLLLAQADARRAFAEVANLDSALAEQAAGWQEAAPRAPVKAIRTVPMHPWRWVTAAAAAIALGFGLWSGSISSQPYATVVRGMGLLDFTPGMDIRTGWHDIEVGTVEFVTARGARVVIEAPASFAFETGQRLRMKHGRVAADVPPPAKGFTVITPTGKAVDLGTKFGVDVSRHGQSEIHVFQGEVIAQSAQGGKRQSLRDGEAFSLESGAGTAREIRSAAFIQPDETASLQAALSAGQQARSEQATAALRADPALIAYLDFEGRSLPEGTFRLTQGRWPGSKAPEFVHVGDHMKLNVGGDHSWPHLTLAAWVRLDRLEAPYQSLYHTDGWDEDKSGQVHWIINRDGTLRLALKHNTLAPGSMEKQGFPDSSTPVLPEQGRWAHLAVVYDADRATVRFYLNGRFDKETRLAIAHPARLGPAQIGNWNSRDRKLSGRVDDLFLLGRCMREDEIHSLYEAGNPYR